MYNNYTATISINYTTLTQEHEQRKNVYFSKTK